MSYAVRHPRVWLALLASLAVLSFGALKSDAAEASWANFCNPVTLGGYGSCHGGSQYLSQVYGWGDQHSVCVEAYPTSSSRRCSSGPGAGVYTPNLGSVPGMPTIINNASGTNTVHGVVFW